MDAPPGEDSGATDASPEDGSTDADAGAFDAGMLSPECYAPGTETDLGDRFQPDLVGIDVGAGTDAFTVTYPDRNNALVLQRFGADGTPDGDPVIPFPRTGFYSFPSLAYGPSDLAAAYLTTEPGFRQVRVATRDHASTDFRPPSRISAMGELPGRVIVGPLGSVGFALAYSTRDSARGTHLYYARVDPSGALLEMPTEVATGISLNGFDLARDGDGTAVVWQGSDGSGSTLWIRPTDLDGLLLAEPIAAVSGRRLTGRPAAVRVPGDGTLVAWAETVGGARSEIHALLVQDSGASMFTERIVSGIEEGTQPDLAAMPLAAAIAYRGMASDGPGLRFRLLTFDGEPLIDPMTIGATETMGGEVAIGASLDGRSFGVAWTDIVGTALEARFVAVPCGG